MATRDESVLPTIKELAVGASQGQSGVGSYGHRFSSRNPDGSFHGPLVGYGGINNAALTMDIGIILARKCGVEHEEITRAIRMGKRFFDFYVEHGTIPYGDHWPSYEWLDDNGKNAQAAKHRIKEGLDLCMELAVEERDKSTGWVPWHAKTLLETLPNYGKDAEPVVKVIEQWPVLKGRGAAELVAKLQDLKKKIEGSEKLPLRHIGK